MARLAVRILIFTGVLAIVVVAGGWLLLPSLVANMPGRLRHYVPDQVVALVETPLPPVLPTPVRPPVTPELLFAPAAIDPTATPALLSPPTPVVTPVGTSVIVPSPPSTASAPAEPAPAATPTVTIEPLPPIVRLEGLPVIAQKFNNCGPANLATVLAFHGQPFDQLDIAAAIRPNYEDRNVSPDELAAFVEDNTDLRALAASSGSLDTLRALLAAGLPVIIEKGLIPDETTGWMGHYQTLYGYDDLTGHFYARDTFQGPWEGDGWVDYESTEAYWHHFNSAFVVVYPESAETVVQALVLPGSDDRVAALERSAALAQDTVGREPENAFAWFNLGASLTHLAAATEDDSRLAQAVFAFDEARTLGLPWRMLWYQFEPLQAYLAAGRYDDVLALAESTHQSQGGRNVEEVYYYLGRAHEALGDSTAAAAAFRRVSELNPAGPLAEPAALALERLSLP